MHRGQNKGHVQGASLVRDLSFYPKNNWKLWEISRCQTLLHHHTTRAHFSESAGQGKGSAVTHNCTVILVHMVLKVPRQ